VQATLGGHFTELTDDKIAWVQEVLNDEETSFRKTLGRGTRVFKKMTADAKDGVISGDTAWRLYSTYGFPVDLTSAMAEENGMKINMEEYEAAKKQAAIDSAGAGGDKKGGVDMDVTAIGDLEAKKVPATNDVAK
jgi:alanyl-tRNA synthetase